MADPHATSEDLSAGLLDGLDAELAHLDATASTEPHQPRASFSEPFFGSYEIINEIGAGGVATVYRARHVHPQYAERPTALKLLQSQASDDPRIVHLFRREAGVLSLIRHRNIVETFEAGIQDGRPYLAMEYVLGGDLEQLYLRLQHKGVALQPALWAHIVCEVLAGLSFAHGLKDMTDQSLHLVHRDVNPANVFISFTGCIKLGDFGVASIVAGRTRRDEEIAGKAGYFAPEHLAETEMDGRADLFAVGAMLFELWCGRRLYRGDSEEAVLQQNRAAQPPDFSDAPAHVTPQMQTFLRRALAKKPKDRFDSAEQMRSELQSFAAPAPQATLLLQAVMRQFFAREEQQEHALASSAYRHVDVPSTWRSRFGQRPKLDLLLGDGAAHDALLGLLQPLGYDCQAYASLEEWAKAKADEPPGDVVLLAAADARDGAQAISMAHAHVAVMRRRKPQMALVVAGDAYTLEVAEVAHSWSAEDLWIRPFRAARATHGLRVLLQRRLDDAAASVSTTSGDQAVTPQGYARAILYVGPSLLLADAQALQHERLSVVQDPAAALQLADRASFDVLIVDDLPAGALPGFVEAFRSKTGMGPVPAIYQGMQDQPGAETLPRLVLAPRGAPLLPAVGEALASKIAGDSRAHTRFTSALEVELRCSGRIVAARTINISRRGVLLASSFLPSVGTEVGLSFVLTDGSRVTASGRAQRVAMRQDKTPQDNTEVHLGIALGHFARGDEPRWVAHIMAVAQQDVSAKAAPGVLQRAARWFGGNN